MGIDMDLVGGPPSTSYSDAKAQLSGANAARVGGTIPGPMGGGGGGLMNYDFSPLGNYKRENALRDYIYGEQQTRQKYVDERQAASDAQSHQGLQDYERRYRENDDRNRMIRKMNGQLEPGFAGMVSNQGGSPQQTMTDLDMWRMSQQHNQQNGVGNMFGYRPQYQAPQYQNQANPYQPRSTELNNAPNNYLNQMMTRGIRG